MQELEERQETLCVHIRAEGHIQSTKNPSSVRFTPLSSILLRDFNFLGYLEDRCKEALEPDAFKKHKQVFPDLIKKDAVDKFSNSVSRWFQRYREEIKLGKGVSGERKDFHSFRDTVSYWCDQIGQVPEKPSARYVGHAYKGMTFGLYSKDTAPHILYDLITVPFSEYIRNIIDIPGLASSKWAQHGK